MIGSIWSSPTVDMREFPLATLIRFCHNHGLLQVRDRPQWRTVRSGSRQYVRKLLAFVSDARAQTPVRSLQRQDTGVRLVTDDGAEHFDAAILACHPDQALGLIGTAASAAERKLLGAIRYRKNLVVLHTDGSVLPRRRRAWASWNYERDGTRDGAKICLHYLINRLQPLPWSQSVIVSMNPVRDIDPARVHAQFAYEHPVFDVAAMNAQSMLAGIQGKGRVWYCGAWCGYGFHEDGLQSGFEAATQVAKALASPDAVLMPLPEAA
jgi:predicted NAD/FAD-binding protein